MVIVHIKGGLGNQMFQYALGRKISESNNSPLLLDLSWFNNMGNDTPRKYVLDKFKINCQVATIQEIKKLKGGGTILNDRYNRLIKKGCPFLFKNYILEKSPYFDPSILNHKGNVYLEGFWSDFRYFADMNVNLINDFTLLDSCEIEKNIHFNDINRNSSVSVHIRRGDYANRASTREFHGLLPKIYFESSIIKIAELIPNAHFYLFSDDILWVKENLILNHPHTFVEPSPDGLEIYDLKLMSLCKHNIISNSTFSWWSAWLNDSPNKIVIAPPFWSQFVPETTKIIPINWKINHYA
jgi:hypothetical protein